MKNVATTLVLTLAVAAGPVYGADPVSFKRASVFNVPDGGSAEIVSVTPDGSIAVYTNAITKNIGFVLISSPFNPLLIGVLPFADEPTSVDITGDGKYAIVCIKGTGTGSLAVVRIATRSVVGTIPLSGEPDSIDLTTHNGQAVAVVAIENEETPAVPGNVAVVTFNPAAPAGASVKYAFANPATDLVGKGLLFETDPEPEFVAIHEPSRLVAVTLQENNGIAIIDIANPLNPIVTSVFSAGVVADRPADLLADARVSLTQVYPSGAPVSLTRGARTPDAIAWLQGGTSFAIANEGEANFSGGRGWSILQSAGGLVWDDNGSFEQIAKNFGYYPDARSNRKGTEPEGIAAALFGSTEFVFVASERGNFVAVYKLVGGVPQFVQTLPASIAPEGIKLLPQRNLALIASEGDGYAGVLSIFVGSEAAPGNGPSQPTITSTDLSAPLGWGALSGLAQHPANPNVLYTVSDKAFQPSLFRIDLAGSQASITELGRVQAANIDLEGIALDPKSPAGTRFWVASEGVPPAIPNLILHVESNGTVLKTIALPPSVAAAITSNGYEGVAVSGDGNRVLVAIQRELTGDQPTVSGRRYTRVGVYNLLSDAWEAFYLYPLEAAPPARPDLGAPAPWVALSDISYAGKTLSGKDLYAVIERDNRLSGLSQTKLVCFFTLDGLVSFGEGLLPAGTTDASLKSARTVIYKACKDISKPLSPLEKVEGVFLARDGSIWFSRDNDGAGHSLLQRLNGDALPWTPVTQ